MSLLTVMLTILNICRSTPVLEVKMQNVVFRGRIVKQNDKHFGVFLKIPYAKPPVNKFRFTNPRPVDYYKALNIIDATGNFSKKCIQFGKRITLNDQSEDCLYLNIVTPKFKVLPYYNNTEFGKLYPVMVWIHGGGFVIGSASEFSVNGIIRNFAQRDVVVVTINYRLGPLGFWNTKSSTAPGNYGLWDQVEALKWVKKYIRIFGGNANNVTIFGVSAGGSSVSFLTLSPAARGLFQQAILMSGSSLAHWALTYDNDEDDASGLLSEDLRCRSKIFRKSRTNCFSKHFNASAISLLLKEHESELKCMRKIHVKEILDKAKTPFNSKECSIHINVWTPRTDGDFFPEDIESLLLKRPPINLIIGIAKQDGANFAIQDHILTREKFENISIPSCITCQITSHPEIVRRVVKDKYTSHPDNLFNVDEENYFWLYQDIKMKTNLMFLIPAYKETLAALNTNSTVYLYSWDYKNAKKLHDFDNGFFLTGAFHNSEVKYLFGNFLTSDSYDYALQNTLATMWTNFAKYGNPTHISDSCDEEQWNPTSSKLEYLSIDAPISTMKPNFYEEDVKFWGKLIPELEKAAGNEM